MFLQHQLRTPIQLSRNISRLFCRNSQYYLFASASGNLASPYQSDLKHQSLRTIFTTNKRFSLVSKELQDALQTEIKAELEVEEENLGGKAPPSIPGFKIEKDGAEFHLTKTHGDEKILVSVNVNHSVDIEDEEDADLEDEQQQRDIERESVPVSLPPFRVEITKGNQRLCFYLELVKSAEGGYDFSVDEFLIAPATKGDKYEDVPDEVYSSSGKYIDPQLHELLFIRYLEERGFNTQFCHDMVKFATHYEHQQYVQLLEKLKKFVAQ